MKCNLIGAGKLGQQVMKSFINAQILSLEAVCNQSLASSQQAVERLGQGKACASVQQLPVCDVLFLAVPDNKISHICQELLTWGFLDNVKIILHFSGALSSGILKPLQIQRQAIASLHPLKSFQTDHLEENSLKNVDCIMEGDYSALLWIEASLKILHARVHKIDSRKKTIYHAAASISANYLTTLADISFQFFVEAGISEENAPQMIAGLMQSCIHNFSSKQRPIGAITGPLIREDYETIRMHCEAIEDSLLLESYKQLALTTANRAGFSEPSLKKLNDVLK